MSEQKQTRQQSILHLFFGALFRRKPRKAMKQTSQLSILPPPPRPEEFEDWDEYIHIALPAYWEEVGQPWRTEPEIDVERQNLFNELRARRYDENSFRDIKPKLTRADIEWLLATHEDGRGFVDWRDPYQRDREGLDLRGANLKYANLRMLPLACMRGNARGLIMGKNRQQRAEAAKIHLEGANLDEAHLEGASLNQAYLAGADLRQAHLEDANLFGAHLEGAILYNAHLEGANLQKAHLEGANFHDAYFDTTTNLKDVTLGNEKMGFASLADVHWGDVNLSVIDWTQVKMLGEERLARQPKENYDKNSVKKTPLDRYKETQLDRFKIAVRANRQLAVVLQAQGLNEEATRFAYRAQKLQRVVFRRQKKFGQYIFSGFLDLLAGYGYHPLRTLPWYIFTLCTFALAYYYVWVTFHLEQITKHPLSFVGAIIFSVTAFHGRGFFSGGDFGYDSLITILAAIEAIIGLIIEFSFIATFTQRFFGR